MDLAKMIIPSKTVWCDYPGVPGFEVQLAHLTRDELMKIRSKSTNKKISKRTRGVEEQVDSELFQDLYISAVLKGWKGLKLKYLNKFFPTNVEGEDLESELEFSEENAQAMMKNSSEFDNWVDVMIEDVENFSKPNSN